MAANKKQRQNDSGSPVQPDPEDVDSARDISQLDADSGAIVEDGLAADPIVLKQAWTDQQGLIRIGLQPVAAHDREVRSAPGPYILENLQRKLQKTFAVTDSKLPGLEGLSQQDLEKLLPELTSTLV